MINIPVYPDPKHPGRFVTRNRLLQNEQKPENHETKVAEPVATKESEPVETPTISAEGQKAIDDIAKLKGGGRIDMGHTPQVEAAKTSTAGEREFSRLKENLAKLKAGVPFNRNSGPTQQAEPRMPEPPKPVMTLEEQAKVDWEKSAMLRKEFLSFENYLAYGRKHQQGKTKLHRGIGGCKD